MKKLIIAAPILSGILWGSTGLFVRSLAGMGMNSLTIMFSRVFLAMFMLLIGILLYDRSLLKIKIRDLWIFIAAGLIGTLGLNFCYNESISRLTLSLSAVLLSLAPVFVLLMAAV
ncbi:MAG: EamA family transporter, partial [Anaerovoracaceae bacterium]